MRIKKTRATIYVIIAMVFVFFVSVGYGYYKTEYSKRPVVQEKVEQQDIDYLYNFYLTGNPNINNRPYYGSGEAGITLIAYIDPTSESGRFFASDIMLQLEQEFVSPSKIRFYHKNYLTVDDMSEKTDRFIYAKSLSCFDSFKRESYYDFYFDILKTEDVDDIAGIAEKHGMEKDFFLECLEDGEFPEIKEDISEVDSYGILGITPRLYIGLEGADNTIIDGIPTYTRLRRTIRNYQTQIGD